MAFIHMDLYSEGLRRNTNLTVILPSDLPAAKTQGNPCYERPMKTIYALHGIECDCFEWPLRSGILELAYKNNVAVICPNGENSFYVNGGSDDRRYGDWIGEELVEKTRAIFNLSHTREDTVIMGFSMGGYGALVNGLANLERFGKIGAFAPAGMFMDLPGCAAGFEADLEGLLARIVAEGKADQLDINMFCGREDFMYEDDVRLNELLRDHGINVSFTTGEGGHHWSSWNTYLEDMVHWAMGDDQAHGNAGDRHEEKQDLNIFW